MYSPAKLFQSWPGLVSRFCTLVPFFAVLSFLLIFAGGCEKSSIVKLRSSLDPNQIIELSGRAAYDYSVRLTEVQVANMQTAKGRQNEMLAELKKVLPWLGLAGVAGVVFWGFTRSRYGWIIPGAAVGGIIFIIAIGRWAEWVTAGVILIALGILVWKCIEYKRERNQNGNKKTGTVADK